MDTVICCSEIVAIRIENRIEMLIVLWCKEEKISFVKIWWKNEITKLISIYKERLLLYNAKDTEYRNRDKKNCYKKSEIVNSIEEFQHKIHNLRNQDSLEELLKGEHSSRIYVY
ncbi:uncharacterized protein LOC143145018 isoform X2 [Ptiloglossa arizonensis]|uniref:uncharacterized protein LOC143145018 isoform X2 n=1 Tax=Ptiloglossa arizonensis TaxID=3350558 RepID=UPI003FA0360D